MRLVHSFFPLKYTKMLFLKVMSIYTVLGSKRKTDRTKVLPALEGND